jgi:hypothetical protein
LNNQLGLAPQAWVYRVRGRCSLFDECKAGQITDNPALIVLDDAIIGQRRNKTALVVFKILLIGKGSFFRT